MPDFLFLEGRNSMAGQKDVRIGIRRESREGIHTFYGSIGRIWKIWCASWRGIEGRGGLRIIVIVRNSALLYPKMRQKGKEKTQQPPMESGAGSCGFGGVDVPAMYSFASRLELISSFFQDRTNREGTSESLLSSLDIRLYALTS